MLFFGNLLNERGVTRRLANTASGPLIDVITILLGLTVGADVYKRQPKEVVTFSKDAIELYSAIPAVVPATP